MSLKEFIEQAINNKNQHEFYPKTSDIYTGEERIQFNERHPIFKALMKLEFEHVIRSFHKEVNQK